MVSNSVNNSSGWQGIISCSGTPIQGKTHMGSAVRVTCDMLFYDSGGPNGFYGNNENKIITFYSNGNCGVRVDFTSFSTESNLDRLLVYDGVDINAPLIGTYSGNLAPFFVQSSASNALTFRFISDNSINNSGWVGIVSCPNSPSIPTISSNSGFTLCPGDTIQLTASLGSSYLWNTGQTTQSIDVYNPGTYLVRVTNASGCFAWSNPVVVSGGTNNTITLTSGSNSNNQTICLGSSISAITYSSTGATGANFIGLPSGVSGIFNAGNITISGVPNVTGTFNYTVELIGGCGNVTATGIIVVEIIDNTVSQNGNILTSNQLNANYQWIDCNTNLPIPGANQSVFISNQSGNYAVIISYNGCIDTSNCVNVTVTNEYNKHNLKNWKVYPNPNQGVFYLETSMNGNFELIDLNGKVLKSMNNIVGRTKIEINLPSGIYILREINKNQHQKLVIE
jgi:hypothetical protein